MRTPKGPPPDPRPAPGWRRRLAACLLLVGLLSTGCLLDATGKDRCEVQTDCLAGYLCEEGRCVEDPDIFEPDVEPDVLQCGPAACGAGEACNLERCMRPARDGVHFLCDAGDPCPEPQACINGVCAASCLTDFDCPEGDFCDDSYGHCVPADVHWCPDTPCEANQICVRGLCSAVVQAGPCWDPEGGSVDGCAADEVCLTPDSRFGDFLAFSDESCVSRPPCDEFGGCPRQPYGGFCNDGSVQGKARMCMPGRCLDRLDCDLGFVECAFFSAIDHDGLGWCTRGELGEICNDDAQCDSSSCSCNEGASCATRGECQ